MILVEIVTVEVMMMMMMMNDDNNNILSVIISPYGCITEHQ